METILCGIDLGGTKLSAGLFDLDGRLIDKKIAYDHNHKTEDMIVEQIALLVKALLHRNDFDEDELKGIGVGFPGHLRFKEGITITTSNLPGFKNYPFKSELQNYFEAPVIVDNDVNSQAFGEFKFGAGKGKNSMIFLTLSTGIGAGIIINKKIYRGMTGTAGECGHAIVDVHSDLQCTCGNFGCWMALASGIALPKLFEKKIEAGFKSSHPDWKFDYAQVDGKFIKKGLDAEDPLSQAIVNECADINGIGLYNLFQIFNPPMIMLGGGLMNWGPIFLDRIRYKFHAMVKNMLHEPIEIVLSGIGPDAGLYGAAALVLEQR
jgi:glucokinase